MQQPHGGRFFTSSTSSSVQLPQHTVSCGALHYFFALVKLDFVPTAGVLVTVSGFVGATGSVGTTMLFAMIAAFAPVMEHIAPSSCCNQYVRQDWS